MRSKLFFNKIPYFYPSADELLLIRAAIGSDQKEVASAFESWVSLKGFTDFRFDKRFVLPLVYDSLEEGSKRLLPLVYSNFRRLKIEDKIVRQFASYHRYTTFRNRMLQNELDGILQELEKGGYRYYIRKGLAYLELFYRDYGARPTSDIDIVVDQAHVMDIMSSSVLENWTSDINYELNRIDHSLSHAITLRKNDFELDLHWRFGHHPVIDDWHERIANSVINRNGINTLSNELHLIDTLTHGFRFNTVRPIRWICDAVHILRDGIEDWELIVKYAKECSEKLPIHSGLNLIAKEKLGVVPDDVINTLKSLKDSKTKALYFHIISRTTNDFPSIFKNAISTNRNPFQIPIKVLNHYKFSWNQSNYFTLFIYIVLVTFEKLISKRKVFLKRLRHAKD